MEQPIIENSLPGVSGVTLVNISGMNGGSAVQSVRYRAWEKDYFTSALPWAQRGGEVNLPISGELPVNGYLKSDPTQNYGQVNGRTQAGTANLTMNLDNPPSTPAGAFDLNLKADLGEGVSVTVNDLRRSIKLQEWLEKNARGGARYIEQIFSHFGVKSSDARLQCAEFLGGGKTPVMISEVLQTSGSPAPESPLTETPLGTMAGHALQACASTKLA